MVSIMDLFGWVGAFVSICFFSSPILKFIQLIKKKIQYKDINILIILGNYISSIVWLIYGYKISCTQLIVCYSIGAFISLIWLWIYLIKMGKKQITLTLIYALILSALTFSLYITLAIIINDKDTLGEVCFIVCSLSYISPTQLLIKVLNKKDYRIIPIISAIISGLGFGSWTIFGLFQFSATIIIPNLVGFIFSAAQIILYRVYKNKRPLEEEIGNISTSVIGAVKNVVERTVEIANNINQKTQNDTSKENGQTTNTNNALEVTKYGRAASVSFLTISEAEFIKNTLNDKNYLKNYVGLSPMYKKKDKIDKLKVLVMAMALDLEMFENAYLSSVIHNQIANALKIKFSTRLFAESTLDIISSGEAIEKLDKKYQDAIIALQSDFMQCKCQERPFCQCMQRGISEVIINERLKGKDPQDISNKLFRKYQIQVYPGDIFSWLDNYVKNLDAIRRIAKSFDKNNIVKKTNYLIKKIENG